MLHGGDIYTAAVESGYSEEELLDFSANISPLGIPKNVEDTLIRSIKKAINYPDPLCRKLKESISNVESIDKNFITCGNGAADVLYRLVFGLKPKKTLIPIPTFLEYEEAFKAVEAKVEYYKMDEDFEIKGNFLENISEDMDMIVICNPNNPTGIVTKKDLLIEILEKAKAYNILLLVDECFLEFIDDYEELSMKNFVNEYDNLFILKSFTKLYAIPGIRLGYGITSNLEIIAKINNAGQAWSVNSLAQEAGVEALKETKYKDDVRKYVNSQRIYLLENLRSLGLKVFDSKANYIMFQAYDLSDLKAKLIKKGIMIRSCDNYPNLSESYYRVAVKRYEDNEKLIKALKELL